MKDLRKEVRKFVEKGGRQSFDFSSLARPRFGEYTGAEIQRIIDEEVAIMEAKELKKMEEDEMSEKIKKAHIPYITFMKHAEKVTRTAPKNRPILSAVYQGDGRIIVTDSHRLYVTEGEYSSVKGTVDPKTGLPKEVGQYPDINRLLPDEERIKYTHIIDVNTAYEAVRAIEIANRVKRKDTTLAVIFDDNRARITTYKGAAFKVEYASDGILNATGNSDHFLVLESKYLLEVLHLLRDSKVEGAYIKFQSYGAPLVIEAGNFTALIMPKRLKD